MMIIHQSKPLFAWDDLEDSPSLKTIKDLLAALPDGKLLESLRVARGKGRNEYPVSVLWGVIVLRVALRHLTTEAVLDELRRNEGLRRLIGIESESDVPKKWNMSRFEEVLGQEPHRTLLKEIFNGLIQRLGAAIPDLGRDAAGDGETLPEILRQAQANLPKDRIKTLAYDKAADGEEVHKHLSEERITPLIQMRSLWKSEPERMLPGHDGGSNVVYTEDGTIHCYDKVSEPPVRHKMSYIGHEPERQTLKYRCPAKHEGWGCPMSEVCNAGKTYGKTVRVNREIDPRRFPALPRATKKFERMYKGRTSVERVNARLKIFWGVDDGNVTGSRRFVAQVGVVLAVHATFATLLASAPRREGTLGKLQLSPIAKALRAKAEAGPAAAGPALAV